jgi:hypothetical protein
MPNLLELVKLAQMYNLPVRVSEAALLSYGGVQVRARPGRSSKARNDNRGFRPRGGVVAVALLRSTKPSPCGS